MHSSKKRPSVKERETERQRHRERERERERERQRETMFKGSAQDNNGLNINAN